MTLTDEQYVETIAAVKRGDQILGTIHVYRWCDGSTAWPKCGGGRDLR